MRILNHELSEKTQKIYNEIINDLDLPVEIRQIEGDDTESNGYCQMNDNHYLVYVDGQLEDDVFESVLIHELLHCKQIQEGCPGLIPAKYGDYPARFIASTINSVVADIDVEAQLSELGLHSDYIDHFRYLDAIAAINEYNNPYLSEVYLPLCALNLVLIKKTSRDPSYYDELYILFENQDDMVIQTAEEIINIIDKYGYKTAREQLRSIRRIAICLGWRARLRIVYNGIEQAV